MYYVKTMTSNQDILRRRVYAFHAKNISIKPMLLLKNIFKKKVFINFISVLRRKEDGISAERQSCKNHDQILYKAACQDF